MSPPQSEAYRPASTAADVRGGPEPRSAQEDRSQEAACEPRMTPIHLDHGSKHRGNARVGEGAVRLTLTVKQGHQAVLWPCSSLATSHRRGTTYISVEVTLAPQHALLPVIAQPQVRAGPEVRTAWLLAAVLRLSPPDMMKSRRCANLLPARKENHPSAGASPHQATNRRSGWTAQLRH